MTNKIADQSPIHALLSVNRVDPRSDFQRKEAAILSGGFFSAFFFHRDLHLAYHVAMQADWHFRFAQALDGFIKLNLAPVDIEALALQRLSNISRGDR